MTNGQANKTFLESIETATAEMILTEIAKHYETSTNAIYSEVTDDHAEYLFEYMVTDNRIKVYNTMKILELA
jgi:uncharacterized damage-inducible protein DinB